MKPLIASALTTALSVALSLAATAALADTPDGGGAASQPSQPCAIGMANGVAGTTASLREYLSLPERDRFRYLMDNQLSCKISDEGRASGCAGLTNLRRDRVSVYDDSDSTVTTVVARVDLDQGTFPVMVDLPKANLKCER
ncbi:hypothetical protein [Burkholderia gladioli]|uniref:hypothetical protein n=1 Tax=Burkholderia gladioli TaxID=28095 RepID=UPI0016417A0D|nr:hypothetical protein [Burkholderia gladioli]